LSKEKTAILSAVQNDGFENCYPTCAFSMARQVVFMSAPYLSASVYSSDTEGRNLSQQFLWGLDWMTVLKVATCSVCLLPIGTRKRLFGGR